MEHANTATAGAIARNEALRAQNIWAARSGEDGAATTAGAASKPRCQDAKMHCVKLLGQHLMAREFDRQVAEFQVRVAVLNGFTALGISITKVVG